MSLFDKARRYIDLGSLTLTVLEAVIAIAKAHVGKDSQAALDGLEKIVKVGELFKDSVDGNITSAEVKAEILKMRSDIAANDAAADAAVDEKFPPGDA